MSVKLLSVYYGFSMLHETYSTLPSETETTRDATLAHCSLASSGAELRVLHRAHGVLKTKAKAKAHPPEIWSGHFGVHVLLWLYIRLQH